MSVIRDLVNMQIMGRGLNISRFQEVVTYLLCKLVGVAVGVACADVNRRASYRRLAFLTVWQ